LCITNKFGLISDSCKTSFQQTWEVRGLNVNYAARTPGTECLYPFAHSALLFPTLRAVYSHFCHLAIVFSLDLPVLASGDTTHKQQIATLCVYCYYYYYYFMCPVTASTLFVSNFYYYHYQHTFYCILYKRLILSSILNCVTSWNVTFCLVNYRIGWLTFFLIQAVRINNNTSDYIAVKSGVPQGSVLGPGLFLIFIIDIVDIFASGLTVKLVEDDVKMHAIINDVNDSVLMQEGLDALYAWSDLRQLPLSLQNALFYILVGITLTIIIQ